MAAVRPAGEDTAGGGTRRARESTHWSLPADLPAGGSTNADPLRQPAGQCLPHLPGRPTSTEPRPRDSAPL